MSPFRHGPQRPESPSRGIPTSESGHTGESGSEMYSTAPESPKRRRRRRYPTGDGPDSETAERRPRHLPTVEETSAGGMVVREINGRHQVAIIARYNRGGRLEWVLPKGHPENEENHRQAAEREIAEETGIQGTVLARLGSIDYWFTVPGQRIHKTVHHFLLRATGGELTIENDPDQEAVDVAWVDLDRLSARLTFLNERRIVEAAHDKMGSFFTMPPRPRRQRQIMPRPRQLPSGFIASVSGRATRKHQEPSSTLSTPTPLTVRRAFIATLGTTGGIQDEDATQRPDALRDEESSPRPCAPSPSSPEQGEAEQASGADTPSATEDTSHTPTPFELRMRIRRFRAAGADEDTDDEGIHDHPPAEPDGPPKPGPHLHRRRHL